MEEKEYRSTYHSINKVRCVFEKALVTKHCKCSRSQYIALAEREGYGCNLKAAQQRCIELQSNLRHAARFVLGITTADGPLPHNKEIRVQVGGMRGLQKLCSSGGNEEAVVEDIDATIESCIAQWGSIDQFPMDRILPSIVSFEGRKKRRKK